MHAGGTSAQLGRFTCSRLYGVQWSKTELAFLQRALSDVEADPNHNKRAFFKEVFDRFSEYPHTHMVPQSDVGP